MLDVLNRAIWWLVIISTIVPYVAILIVKYLQKKEENQIKR